VHRDDLITAVLAAVHVRAYQEGNEYSLLLIERVSSAIAALSNVFLVFVFALQRP